MERIALIKIERQGDGYIAKVMYHGLEQLDLPTMPDADRLYWMAVAELKAQGINAQRL